MKHIQHKSDAALCASATQGYTGSNFNVTCHTNLWIYFSFLWLNLLRESCPLVSSFWSSSWECLRHHHRRHPCPNLHGRNILITGQFALLSIDLCGSGHTFLLFWNTFHFLFWLLLSSLFSVFFFCLLFLHLLSICYKTVVRQCDQIWVLVKENDFS